MEVAEGESVLDAALRQGVFLPYGCRDGRCGSCAGRILQGEVGYPRGTPASLGELNLPDGFALLCQAVPLSDLVIEVRELASAADIRPRKFPARAARIEHLAPDVIRLYLEVPRSERIQFLAGQYLDFLLADGKRRSFSIANAPHDDTRIELHIRHVEGGEFTDYVFDRMKEKAILRIEGPFGGFCLREASPRPILLVGGGTGFAPLKGMIEYAFHTGLDRPMHLYWGVRSRVDLYLPDLPRGWVDTQPGFRYTPVLSEPKADDVWEGATGFVHEAVVAQYGDLSAHEVYMAGPPAMIAAARAAFHAAGLPQDALFYDSFEYAAR